MSVLSFAEPDDLIVLQPCHVTPSTVERGYAASERPELSIVSRQSNPRRPPFGPLHETLLLPHGIVGVWQVKVTVRALLSQDHHTDDATGAAVPLDGLS